MVHSIPWSVVGSRRLAAEEVRVKEQGLVQGGSVDAAVFRGSGKVSGFEVGLASVLEGRIY